MGVIEVMAVGNGIPDLPLSLGVAPVLMLAVLGMAVLGIVMAIPRRSVPALRLVHAASR